MVTAMSSAPIASIWVAHGSPEPATLRAQLPPGVAAVFDREWQFVLEAAKPTQDLHSILDLMVEWRFVAFAEAREPGSYFRTLDIAERILAAGSAEAAGITSVPGWPVIEERMRELGMESELERIRHAREAPPAT